MTKVISMNEVEILPALLRFFETKGAECKTIIDDFRSDAPEKCECGGEIYEYNCKQEEEETEDN